MVEPIMPTRDAAPILFVAQTVSNNVRKVMTLCIIGSPSNRKPNGATVRFRATHNALKRLIKAKSLAEKSVFEIVNKVFPKQA
jgi:hypothetical protein